MKNRHSLAPFGMLLAFLALFTLTPACSSTGPHSLQHLETMDPAAYQDWLANTVRPWSEAAGTLAVTNELASLEEVQGFTGKLRQAANLATIPPSVIVDIAAACGWKDRRAVLSVVATGNALLAARGGLRVLGDRAREVLMTVAAGVDAGALLATTGQPPYPGPGDTTPPEEPAAPDPPEEPEMPQA